jgi:hypothetical protein
MWHDVMTFAHQNLELKQGIGLPPPDRKGPQNVIAQSKPEPAAPASTTGQPAAQTASAAGQPQPGDADHPWQLTNASLSVLTEIDGLMRTAPIIRAQKGAALEGVVAPGKGLTVVAGDGKAKTPGLVEVR